VRPTVHGPGAGVGALPRPYQGQCHTTNTRLGRGRQGVTPHANAPSTRGGAQSHGCDCVGGGSGGCGGGRGGWLPQRRVRVPLVSGGGSCPGVWGACQDAGRPGWGQGGRTFAAPEGG
jgi:hypothetical protein